MTRKVESFTAPYERYSGILGWVSVDIGRHLKVSEGTSFTYGARDSDPLTELYEGTRTESIEGSISMYFELPKEFLE